nr:unnamed protein product [Callosobruchus chinensis]
MSLLLILQRYWINCGLRPYLRSFRPTALLVTFAIEDLAWSVAHISWKLLLLLPCLYLVHRFHTGVRSVTSHSTIDLQTDSAPPSCLFPGYLGPRVDCLVMYLLSLRVLDYSSPVSINFP